MDAAEQLVTVSAVLLGALTTHVTNHFMERQRHRHELATRWDTVRLEAYERLVLAVDEPTIRRNHAV